MAAKDNSEVPARGTIEFLFQTVDPECLIVPEPEPEPEAEVEEEEVVNNTSLENDTSDLN